MAKRVMDADYRHNNNNNNIYTPSSCYHQPKPRFSLLSGNSTLSYVTNALCEASVSLIAVTPSCALLSVFTVDSAPVLLYSALYFDALRRRRIVVIIDGVSHYHHNNNNITNNVEEGGGSNDNNNDSNASDVVMWVVMVAAGFVAWYVRQVCRTVPKDSNKPPSNSIEEVANRCQIPASFFNVGYGGTNHTNNNSSIGGSSNDAIIGSNGYYYYANGGSSWWCNQCFTWARAIWFTSRTLYRWMSTGICFMVVHVMFNVPDDVIALSFVPTVVCAMSMSLCYCKEEEVRGGKGGMIKALLGNRSAVMCVMNFIGLVELVVLTWSASRGDSSYYYSYWGVGERRRTLQHIATGPSAVLALVVMGIVYMESSPSLLCFVLRSLVLLSYFVLGVIHIGVIVSSELVVSIARASGGGMITQQCVVVDPSEPLNCPAVVVGCSNNNGVGDGGNSGSISNSRPRGSSRGLVSLPSVVPDLCMLLLGSWILALWLDVERWSLALSLVGGVELVSLLTCYLFFTVQPPSSS